MTRIRIAGRLWIVDDELRVSDAFPFIPQVVAHDIPGLFQVPQHVADVVHILPEDGGQPTHGVILRFLQGEYDGKLALGFERRPLHVLLCAAVIETPRAGVLPDTENPYMNKSHADRPYGAQPHQRPRAGATAAPAGRRHLRGVDVLALNDDDLTGRPPARAAGDTRTHGDRGRRPGLFPRPNGRRARSVLPHHGAGVGGYPPEAPGQLSPAGQALAGLGKGLKLCSR